MARSSTVFWVGFARRVCQGQPDRADQLRIYVLQYVGAENFDTDGGIGLRHDPVVLCLDHAQETETGSPFELPNQVVDGVEIAFCDGVAEWVRLAEPLQVVQVILLDPGKRVVGNGEVGIDLDVELFVGERSTPGGQPGKRDRQHDRDRQQGQREQLAANAAANLVGQRAKARTWRWRSVFGRLS